MSSNFAASESGKNSQPSSQTIPCPATGISSVTSTPIEDQRNSNLDKVNVSSGEDVLTANGTNASFDQPTVSYIAMNEGSHQLNHINVPEHHLRLDGSAASSILVKPSVSADRNQKRPIVAPRQIASPTQSISYLPHPQKSSPEGFVPENYAAADCKFPSGRASVVSFSKFHILITTCSLSLILNLPLFGSFLKK